MLELYYCLVFGVGKIRGWGFLSMKMRWAAWENGTKCMTISVYVTFEVFVYG